MLSSVVSGTQVLIMCVRSAVEIICLQFNDFVVVKIDIISSFFLRNVQFDLDFDQISCVHTDLLNQTDIRLNTI